MRQFSPFVEAAQSDYETLRRTVLEDRAGPSIAGLRFERRGLAGLILCPVSEPLFVVELVGANRPAWSPYEDLRLGALGQGYALLLGREGRESSQQEVL